MEWKISGERVAYPDALEAMAARVTTIQKGEAEELVWLVEHPPLYTLGTSAKKEDLLQESLNVNYPEHIPSYETGRGGQVTYHGPGQRVVYLMLDLKKRAGERGQEPDLRAYVQQLEQWLIATLAQFNIKGFVREGRVGVWVDAVASRQSPVASKEVSSTIHHLPFTTHEKKIAALGVRVQKWVTSHGIALNVNPDLSHYAGIVPCGIREFGVTSMHQMGVTVGMDAVDAVLRETFGEVFG